MSPRWRPPRLDSDGVTVHADVAHAARYELVTVLRRWNVNTGTIRLEFLRSPTPAKRLTRLVADYEEAGVGVQEVVMCTDELDEAKQIARLEHKIREATARSIVLPEGVAETPGS